MQRDAVFLADILSAADDLRQLVRQATPELFQSSKMLRYAMLHALMVVGEAAAKLSAELKSRHGDVPWQRVTGVRHRIVHDYSGLDYELLWEVITRMVPELEARVSSILADEFPTNEGA
jgi:uncharacterized protein with HEPN domain